MRNLAQRIRPFGTASTLRLRSFMPTNQTGGICPRCSAHTLVWACKMLTGNTVTPVTWVCGHCESVFDRIDLMQAFGADNRENFSQWEKNSSWAY
jgi:hypothetical protein